MRVRRVERKLNASLNSKTNFKGGKGSTQLPPVPAAEELDYFLFENKYRGTLEDIKKRQEIYIDIFRGASHVIDLGCGRGEFVELLKESTLKVLIYQKIMFKVARSASFQYIRMGSLSIFLPRRILLWAESSALRL